MIREETFNLALGAVMKDYRAAWKKRGVVMAEENSSMKGGKRADILIYPPMMSPVVVESAFDGDTNVDGDARREIDKVVCKMLGINPAPQDIQALRRMWCEEPLVHDDKKSIVKALAEEDTQ